MFKNKTLNNPVRTLDFSAKIGTAAASENPTPNTATASDVIKFVLQGTLWYLEKTLPNKVRSCRGKEHYKKTLLDFLNNIKHRSTQPRQI